MDTPRTAARAACAAALVLALVPAVLPLPAAAARTARTADTADTAAASAEGRAAAPQGWERELALPRPSGPYAVGRRVLHLVDRGRTDPWVPEAGARELMVSLYYPARGGTGRPAAYMTEEESRLFLAGRELDGLISAEAVSRTRLSARTGARPAAGRRPLVVLSPGFSLPRHTLTALAQELAARGYAAAAIDHAHESAGAAFPGGRVLTCAACTQVGGDEEFAGAARGRAADVSFVLDELVRRFPGLVDEGRIGMAGHSLGGDAAAAVMAADPRVAAGVNMDGAFFAPVPARGLGGRPFLLVGSAAEHSPGGPDATWDRDWPRLADGWRRWLTVAGASHAGFSDVAVLTEQIGVTDPEAPLSGARHAAIVRDYVTAFFDLHLRGIHRPLLDGPAPAYPEVAFHTP